MNTIKFRAGSGDSIKIKATKIKMQGVEQVADGGNIEQCATQQLTQISNTMEASDGGQILNEVEGGDINQVDNKMKATTGGGIINRISKNSGTITLFILFASTTVAVIGFWSDIVSLFEHYTQK